MNGYTIAWIAIGFMVLCALLVLAATITRAITRRKK